MDLSSTSQVSTLVREPARVGDTAAPVSAASATSDNSGGQSGGGAVTSPRAAQPIEAAEEGHLPVPGSPEPGGSPGERYDIEV